MSFRSDHRLFLEIYVFLVDILTFLIFYFYLYQSIFLWLTYIHIIRIHYILTSLRSEWLWRWRHRPLKGNGSLGIIIIIERQQRRVLVRKLYFYYIIIIFFGRRETLPVRCPPRTIAPQTPPTLDETWRQQVAANVIRTSRTRCTHAHGAVHWSAATAATTATPHAHTCPPRCLAAVAVVAAGGVGQWPRRGACPSGSWSWPAGGGECVGSLLRRVQCKKTSRRSTARTKADRRVCFSIRVFSAYITYRLGNRITPT